MGWEYDDTNDLGDTRDNFDRSRRDDIRDLPRLEIVERVPEIRTPVFIPSLKLPLPETPAHPLPGSWLN